ncbi:unnamed protein product [Closterium sp. NIES-54]
MYLTLYFLMTRLPDSLRAIRDHFLSLDSTELTLASFDSRLLEAETSAYAVAASCGTPRPSVFEECSPSLLAPPVASAADVDLLGSEEAEAASTASGRRNRGARKKGGGGGGGGGGAGGGRGSGGGQQQQSRRQETLSPQQLREWDAQRRGPGGGGRCQYVRCTGPGSGRYTLHTESTHVVASDQVAAFCSCWLLTHPSLLWHHCLGHPSLQRLRIMHSHLLVFERRSRPPLPPSLAPPCTPCIEGRHRAAPHSSSLPPTSAPLQKLHMDVWGPTPISGPRQELFFLLVVDDFTRYTAVFPLQHKGDVRSVLIPRIRADRPQLRALFHQDLLVLRLHFDHGGEFSSGLLEDFCHEEGIT